MFDYRGYGKSTGYPSQETIYQDGQSVYDWMIKSNIKPEDVIVWGESLGGTVAHYPRGKVVMTAPVELPLKKDPVLRPLGTKRLS